MLKLAAGSFLGLMALSCVAVAQGNVDAQCAGASGKTYACCKRIVTANPNISQCAKERAVFECNGSKRYVSPNGCGTFTK